MKRKFLVVACVFAAISLVPCLAEQVLTVAADNGAASIGSVEQDAKVVVTGKLTNALLVDIAKAIADGEHKINLDLSKTTGLTDTEWNATRTETDEDGEEDEYAVFEWCENLSGISLPESVTTIGEYAFTGCTSLASVTIPDSVTTIGAYAFENCTSLSSVTIPNSVTTIGESAFAVCSNLEYVNASARVIQMVKNAM